MFEVLVVICLFCIQLEAESRLAVRLQALEVRVEQFEAQQDQADRRQSDHLKHSETKLSKRMTSVESSLHQELQLLKQEYHKGGLALSVPSCHQWVNTYVPYTSRKMLTCRKASQKSQKKRQTAITHILK